MMERKEYNIFCDAVLDGISDYLLSYNIENIRLETVQHNNGVIHTGLVIILQDEKCAPTIYLESFYEQYRAGMDMEQIFSLIAQQYRAIRKKMKDQDVFSVEISRIKQCVFLRLVNYEKNKELLKDCPYIPFHDMAITFRYLVQSDENGIASALIHNSVFEQSGLSFEELYSYAKENTEQFFPPFFERLDRFLENRFPNEGGYPEQPNIFIVSNKQFIYGATMILYKEVLAQLAELTDSDFYIIPSSVNEVLIYLADETADAKMLETTLREVNAYMVSETDYLSDDIYYYDKKRAMIVSEMLDE